MQINLLDPKTSSHMPKKGKNFFLSVNDLDNDQILFLLQQTKEIAKDPKKFFDKARSKILGLIFFEPSTRTYFSFASAIQRLGGNFIGFADIAATSVAKGESLEDTARTMSAYVDMLVVRHFEVGSLQRIAKVVDIPLINAGEGTAEHPTQALADLYTIFKHFNHFDDITIALYGDLKFGRTNHSLLLAGARLGINFICIAPEPLQMPKEYLQQAEHYGAKIILTDDIQSYYDRIDVLYVSRLQKERLSIHLNYEELKQQFIVNQITLNNLKPGAIIMHPLPRVGEITIDVDQDPRAKYFEQAANGVFMRMAVILYFLSIA